MSFIKKNITVSLTNIFKSFSKNQFFAKTVFNRFFFAKMCFAGHTLLRKIYRNALSKTNNNLKI